MEDKKIQFPTDYPSIMDRINKIKVSSYSNTRNYLNGDVTYLSPYISRGVVSTKQIKDLIVKSEHAFAAKEKLLQELAWREYFQRVWQAKESFIFQDLKQKQPQTIHHKMIHTIYHAKTGIEAIDKGIQSLYETGYMHNHMRMYLASITCNIGNAHWLAPASWLYFHLLDGDLASNSCSWQWVAGSFSNKKYYCNQENINKYTHSKQYNSFLDLSYESIVDMDIPNSLVDTMNLNLSTSLPSTALPIIDTQIPTLIYNGYNLDPLWRVNEKLNRVLLLEPSHFKQFPISNKVLQFIIDLATNIKDIQIYVGEIGDIVDIYQMDAISIKEKLISKEHPAFTHYPSQKDQREWMYPAVTGYYPSFSAFWKRCSKLK